MRVLRIKLADIIIEIKTHFSCAFNMCLPFREEGEPVYIAQCSFEDFEESEKVFEQLYHTLAPSNVYLEVSALLRKISDGLINFNIILSHGAVVALGQFSFLFSAPSGTGKTTHIKKWLERCPDAFVVNGDKPFIKFNDDGTVLACGSPWAGKENMYTNTMVPLKAIVLMERAEDNSIERISFAEAFPKLLEQTYRPEDPDKMRKTLKLMQRLNPAVSFWRFKFNNMKDDCFDVAYNALVGQDQ